MKTKVASIALVAIAGLLAIQAVSERPATAQQQQRPKTSAIEQELLETLTQALDERLAEYEAGRAAPDNAIRLNKELYDAQIAQVDVDGKIAVTEEYVERAKQIEEIAARRLNEGTGTSTALLEAEASRLKAALELQRVKDESGKESDQEDLESQLIGTWKLEEASTPGSPSGVGSRLKFFTGTHWCIVQPDPDTGVVVFHHGGRYEVDGNKVKTTREFAGESTKTMIGGNKTLTIKIESDTMKQLDSDGVYNETWKRVK